VLDALHAHSGHGEVQVMSWFIVYAAAGWVIRLGMIPVILARQFPPGTSLAWLCIVFLHPYLGGLLYLLLGENRLGPRHGRAKQATPFDLKGSAIQMQVQRVGVGRCEDPPVSTGAGPRQDRDGGR
jgi:hypothetical protein